MSEKEFCRWRTADRIVYEHACPGGDFKFTDVVDELWPFCPYCGRRTEEQIVEEL